MTWWAVKDRAKMLDQESFFRSIPQDEFQAWDGHVDSPTGWFGLVEVDDDLRTNLTWNRPEFQPNIDYGWYLVVVDSDGRVSAYQTLDCEGDPVGLRHGLFDNFNELKRQHQAFEDDEEEA